MGQGKDREARMGYTRGTNRECPLCGETWQSGVQALISFEEGFFLIVGTIDPNAVDYYEEVVPKVVSTFKQAGIKLEPRIICNDH